MQDPQMELVDDLEREFTQEEMEEAEEECQAIIDQYYGQAHADFEIDFREEG